MASEELPTVRELLSRTAVMSKKRCYRAAPEPADIATRLLEGEPAPQSVHRIVFTADHSGD
jgi:hypothetical protein